MPDCVPISELNLPGTHDSGTQRVGGTVITELIAETGGRCQNLNIYEQMEEGIRVFDIRLSWSAAWLADYMAGADYSYYSLDVTHGLFDCYYLDSKGDKHSLDFRKVKDWAKEFIHKHPTETVIFVLSRENGKLLGFDGPDYSKEIEDDIYEFIEEYRYYRKDSQFRCYDTDDDVPTLGEVRGKAVFIMDNGTRRTFTQYEMEYRLDKDLGGTMQTKVDRMLAHFKYAQQNYHINWSRYKPTFRRQSECYNVSHPGNPDVMYIGTNATGIDTDSLFGKEPFSCARSFYSNDAIYNLKLAPGYRYGWITMDFPENELRKDYLTYSAGFMRKIIYTNIDEQLARVTCEIDLNGAPPSDVVGVWFYNHSLGQPLRTETTVVGDKIIATTAGYEAYRDKDGNPSDFEARVVMKDGSIYGSIPVSYNTTRKVFEGDSDLHYYEVHLKKTMERADAKIDKDFEILWPWGTEKPYVPSGISQFLAECKEKEFVIGSTKWFTIPVRNTEPGDGPYLTYVEESSEQEGNKWIVTVHDLPKYRGNMVEMDYNYLETVDHPYLECRFENNAGMLTLRMYVKGNYNSREKIEFYTNYMDGGNKYGLRESFPDKLREGLTETAYTYNDVPVAYDRPVEVRISVNEPITIYVPKIMKFTFLKKHEINYPNFAATPYRINTGWHDMTSTSVPDEWIDYNVAAKATLQAIGNITINWHDVDVSAIPTELQLSVPDRIISLSKQANQSPDNENIWVVDNAYNTDAFYLFTHHFLPMPIEMEFLPSKSSIRFVNNLPDFTYTVKSTRSVSPEGYLVDLITLDVWPNEGKLDLDGAVQYFATGTKYDNPSVPELIVTGVYLKDPDGQWEESNIGTQSVDTTAAGLTWAGTNPMTFHMTVPAYTAEHAYLGYVIDAAKSDEFPYKKVEDYTITYISAVSVSGRIAWADGVDEPDNQPVVQLLCDGKPVGQPVSAVNFQYRFDELPATDWDGRPYDYSIEATVDGKECCIHYNDPIVDEATGNFVINAMLYPVPDDFSESIGVKLNLEGVDPATEAESFTFVLRCISDDSVSPVKLELNKDNHFSGSFDVPKLPNNADVPYVYSIQQENRVYMDYWQYDDTVVNVQFKLHYLNGKPAIERIGANEGALEFTNVYAPIHATSAIRLLNEIENRLAGIAEVPDMEFAYRLDEIMPDGSKKLCGYAAITGVGGTMFQRMNYDAVGVHRYVITQQKMDAPGWSFDEKAYPVTMTIIDVNGTLQPSQDTIPVFHNTFVTTVADLSLEISRGDGKNAQGVRPDAVPVTLMSNGQPAGSVQVTAAKNWRHTFSALPVYADANPITYTLEPQTVNHYFCQMTSDMNQGFKIVYTQCKDISISAEWSEPAENPPASIGFILKANGTPIHENLAGESLDNLRLLAAGWQTTVRSLPVYPSIDSADMIEYDVTPEEPTPYHATVFRDGDNLRIVYTRHGMSVRASVRWIDGDNEQRKRPDQVNLYLTANGEVQDLANVDASSGWAHQFINLPDTYVGADGKPVAVSYGIQADEIEGYSMTITGNASEGYVITYVKTESVCVNVLWKDGNNKAGLRPKAITATLMADGRAVSKVQITASEGWRYTFADLPAYTEDSTARVRFQFIATAYAEGDRRINYSLAGSNVQNYLVSTNMTAEDEGSIIYTLIPRTGDDTNLPLLVGMLVLSLGMLGMLHRRKQH